MIEPLVFTIKENIKELETVLTEILYSLKYWNLSEAEAEKQLTIIRELVETEMILDDAQMEDGSITIEVLVEKNSVSVEVRKRFGESSYSSLEELDRVIQRIRAYQSPLDPFMNTLQEAPSGAQPRQSIEHGLAKLALETGAVLDFYVTENHTLSLSAIRYLH